MQYNLDVWMFVCMTASCSLSMLLGMDTDEQTHNDLCEKAWRSEELFVYLQCKWDAFTV